MRKLKSKRQMLLYAISGMGVNMLNLMMVTESSIPRAA